VTQQSLPVSSRYSSILNILDMYPSCQHGIGDLFRTVMPHIVFLPHIFAFENKVKLCRTFEIAL